MKVLIAEDERPASERLKRALREVAPDVEVIATTTSIQSTLEYLRGNAVPDILFLDIELSDGQSFGIFNGIHIQCPVIFTTAYHEYWQQAFEYNSIDYLLKPVEKHRLLSALVKYRLIKNYYAQGVQNESGNTKRPSRALMVRRGSGFVQVSYDEIAYFFASQKLVYVVYRDARRLLVPYTLSELEQKLDPEKFHRVNRKFILNQGCIVKIKSIPKSRLLLQIQPGAVQHVVVTHENTSRFMRWMQGS